jgi:cell division protein FtsQ
VAVYQVHSFAMHSWRFRLRSDSDIELGGEASNSRALVLEKLHEQVGRNIFQISLAEQKQELERIPWVESASVIRLWPNHLRVIVQERIPVAFVALGERIALIDAHGVLMDIPPGVKSEYSFPVILGMNENEPLSTRAPRMKVFMRLMRELDDAGGSAQAKTQYSNNLDEVDLSDPEDVKVVAKGGSSPILLHLGNENFQQRFMVFLSNVQKWEQDRGKLESVDLRYGREVILNPDMRSAPPQSPTETVKAASTPPLQEPAKTSKIRHTPPKKRK